ncbi:3-oxoacyl-ACP reductase [Baekduia sp. Peel2402]|uniref:3-oxoacyl-ACP reductase n=1 Tax=Baekduia sp. Peel2402 TaxID=3458296 RepID=UPI00403E6D59
MSPTEDRYQRLTSTPPGRFLSSRLGLPESTPLRRYEPGQSLLESPALIGGFAERRLLSTVERVLQSAGATALSDLPAEGSGSGKLGAVVFDASGITASEDLIALRDFFSPSINKIAASGRLIVLGTPPEHAADRRHHVAQRALEGFVRSAAKELRHGATGNLVYVAPGAEDDLESTLRFLLSSKSAYVSGQVVRVGTGESSSPKDWEKPQAGRIAAVTGASRGIGEAIARTLARDGAHVIVIDIPQQGEDLSRVANAIGGAALALDITADDAPAALAAYLQERHGGVDVVVHNAGITRDRTVARMKPERWEAVLEVNLSAQERLNDALLLGDLIGDGGRVVTVSSIGGIAGNRGQTNYGASKAGVIGIVETLAPELAQRGATINAVAPGFIETQMTASMPLFVREGGRRMNSLTQGGLPIDVAETIAWFASPASGGVNGNVVRVCGQSLIGA